ncbi:LysR family transcriptional regulator [Apilactobacillus xinyiensis]|uniref:LysR family transcriptional regulator n=1 Tax=Apilactobacillus xinyiensis TaxID=2841032 RepID=UPI001C7CD910|nr:LysR family transcriptional regulator [Apilactobacillus xinyiensis]
MIDQRYTTFLMLTKTKSYTKTAKKLFITQPAVTQQVKSLEKELQIQLVKYHQPHLDITKSGQELAAFINNIVNQQTEFLDYLKKPNSQKEIMFGATKSVAIFMIPKIIEKFSHDFDKINCTVTNTEIILSMIDDGKLDFAILEGNFNKQVYSYYPMQRERFVCVANADNELTKMAKIDINQLLNQTLILRENGSGTRCILYNWLKSLNLSFSDFNQVISFNEPTGIIELIKKNVGISFMYESLALQEISNGNLQEIKLSGMDIFRTMNLVYSRNNYFANYFNHLFCD